jgi:hypothetical protein
MNASQKPPGMFYFLVAIAIALMIWMVMGAPGHDPMSTPMAIARNGSGHR